MTQAIRFTPVKPYIGAIAEVERERMCEPAVVEAIRAALEDRGVIVFPRLDLTDAEQLAFTDAFGDRLDYTRDSSGSDGDDVYRISLDKDAKFAPEYVLATWFWHMDGVTVDQPLPKATMLSARKVSPTGGQTQFANTFAAWNRLPEETKRQIADLNVVHRLEAAMRFVFGRLDAGQIEQFNRVPAMVHPLVWTQRDGRKSLVLGTHADEILEMPGTAGRSLIARLIEWAAQPDLFDSHEWQEGDFVLWNNCGVMHRVVPYEADSGRNMHRTSIMGDQRLGKPLVANQSQLSS